jgi:protein-arginine kinase activator protein McsA
MFMEQGRSPKANTEEQLLGELASLMTQLNLHQEKEEYEKCAEIKKKIDELRKKIDNL